MLRLHLIFFWQIWTDSENFNDKTLVSGFGAKQIFMYYGDNSSNMLQKIEITFFFKTTFFQVRLKVY